MARIEANTAVGECEKALDAWKSAGGDIDMIADDYHGMSPLAAVAPHGPIALPIMEKLVAIGSKVRFFACIWEEGCFGGRLYFRSYWGGTVVWDCLMGR